MNSIYIVGKLFVKGVTLKLCKKIAKSINIKYNRYKFVYILCIRTWYIPLSQAEMAPLIGVSTITINKLFKQLRDDNLLLPIEGKRGKYELTEKAIIIIKDMEKLESKLEEDK